MDPSFQSSLLASGVGEDVVKVLTEQKVFSLRVFRAMKEEHLVRLLQCGGMPIGGHALLWEMWERDNDSPHVPRGPGTVTPSPSPSASSSSSSIVMSSPEDRKELFKRYQLKMKELKAPKLKSSKLSVPSRHMKIHLGGMVYDEDLEKGVKKRYIPPSEIMTFPSSAPYDLVIQKGRETFFPNDTSEADCFCLADSGGVPYVIEEKSDWVLSEFVQKLKQAPSKLRIYLMYRPKALTEEKASVDMDSVQGIVKNTEGILDNPPNFTSHPPPLIHAGTDDDGRNIKQEAVIKQCIACSQPFRTYVPGTDTVMPDGTSFFYSHPQDECPECDKTNWGWQWNKDLFPQFTDYKTYDL